MFRSSRNRFDLAIILVVAAGANFAYLIASNGDFYYPDSFTYLAPARNLLHGLGFVTEPKVIETLRTPGYPLLLALFRARTLPVIILQHLINVGLALAIYVLVLSRLGSRFAALIASLLFAIDTPTIHYANKVLTETVFTLLLYVVFVLTLQRPRPIVVAFLSGMMVLVRPISLFFFVALALFFAFRRVPARQLVTLVAIALALPVTWAARNWYHAGVFTVSSIGGTNMLTYRAAGALAIEDEGDFRADVTDEQDGLIEDADDEIQQKLHIPDARELSEAVRSEYYARFAWRVIGQHPIAFLQLTLRGVLVNLFDSDWDAMGEVSRFYPTIVELSVGTLPVAVFVFAVIGTIALWRTDRAFALLMLLIVVYFIGISAGGEAESRFRVPVIPQLAIAAAAGVEAVRRGLAAQHDQP